MPAASDNFDLVIIGGGPGGYTAAIRAQQLGLKTALVEREHLGGICLNWGCIPTKALLRSAQLYRDIQQAKDHGFDLPGAATIDMQRLVGRSRDIAGQLSNGVRYLMKKNKVTLFDGSDPWSSGRARFARGERRRPCRCHDDAARASGDPGHRCPRAHLARHRG